LYGAADERIVSDCFIAHQLRLIEEENQNTPLTDMVQQLTRFVLGYIIKDSQRISPGSNDMERVSTTCYEEAQERPADLYIPGPCHQWGYVYALYELSK